MRYIIILYYYIYNYILFYFYIILLYFYIIFVSALYLVDRNGIDSKCFISLPETTQISIFLKMVKMVYMFTIYFYYRAPLKHDTKNKEK